MILDTSEAGLWDDSDLLFEVSRTIYSTILSEVAKVQFEPTSFSGTVAEWLVL